MASLIMLGRWFTWMQQNNVYDNTRIIIASDHGENAGSAFPDNIVLPNRIYVQAYNPTFLVKDFGSSGDLTTDNTFMTHADTPLIATSGLIDNAVNPFTGVPLESRKEGGVTIATSSALTYTIAGYQWLHVHDNIFDAANWEQAEK
jgi:arylsulfatase A-like enzyme